jgi:hypothetical protein
MRMPETKRYWLPICRTAAESVPEEQDQNEQRRAADYLDQDPA